MTFNPGHEPLTSPVESRGAQNPPLPPARRVREKKPTQDAFKTTADYYAALVRWRVHEMERKGSECVMQSCKEMHVTDKWLEGTIASFEKDREGVIYAPRIYFAPTDRHDTLVLDRSMLPFEAECRCEDLRDEAVLPTLCQGFHGKTRKWERPNVTQPDSVCLHVLSLYRDYCLEARK